MHLHQTGWRRDDDLELEWHREREIIKIEQMREGEPEIPAITPTTLIGSQATRADGRNGPRQGRLASLIFLTSWL